MNRRNTIVAGLLVGGLLCASGAWRALWHRALRGTAVGSVRSTGVGGSR